MKKLSPDEIAKTKAIQAVINCITPKNVSYLAVGIIAIGDGLIDKYHKATTYDESQCESTRKELDDLIRRLNHSETALSIWDMAYQKTPTQTLEVITAVMLKSEELQIAISRFLLFRKTIVPKA